MEEAKAAAYYEELVAKGGGAARFKQGLGFSSAPAAAKPEVQGLGNFVRAAGSPGDGQANRLEGIRDKERDDSRSSKHGRHRSRSPVRRECTSRDRSSSRERSRDNHRRSSKSDRGDKSRPQRRDSRSPSEIDKRDRRHSSRRNDISERRNRGSTESRKASRDRDYSKLIRNYESMTPAERVKAKLSLQLSETAAKDKDKGMNDGWERFDFDKNARLDDDVEPDYNVGDRTGAPDDTAFLKNTSQSFLSYASQATREKRTESAHEAAMFGVPATNALDNESASQEDINLSGDSTENKAESHVLSEQVIAMQQDSWQERVRKMKAAKSAAAAAT